MTTTARLSTPLVLSLCERAYRAAIEHRARAIDETDRHVGKYHVHWAGKGRLARWWAYDAGWGSELKRAARAVGSDALVLAVRLRDLANASADEHVTVSADDYATLLAWVPEEQS